MVLSFRLQGIGIEEAVAAERHTADQTVVERALQHVVVFRVAMQQKQTVVHIDIADGSTRLAVGRHIRQLIVLAKGLAVAGGADAARDVELLADDIVPDAVDGIHIALVARQRSHIGHTRIHIAGAYGVAHGLVLLHHRLVALRILALCLRLAAIVQQVLRKVQILLLARSQIETGHRHLRYLVTRHHERLSLVGPHLLARHVRIAAGNVQELSFARSLPVGHGTLHHVPQVVQLVAQFLLLHPTRLAGPVVRVGRVLRTRRVEVAVGLLRPADDVYHRVTVGLQPLVGIGLQDIGSALQRLVGVGIVEREAHALQAEHLRRVR